MPTFSPMRTLKNRARERAREREGVEPIGCANLAVLGLAPRSGSPAERQSGDQNEISSTSNTNMPCGLPGRPPYARFSGI